MANTLQFNGSVNITGSLTKGSGSFVQPHPTDPKKEMVYAFFEGPEHVVFFRGKARLVDGKATIETPEYFRVVAGKDEDITVQFTPRSADSEGLAACVVTREKVQVVELKKAEVRMSLTTSLPQRGQDLKVTSQSSRTRTSQPT